MPKNRFVKIARCLKSVQQKERDKIFTDKPNFYKPRSVDVAAGAMCLDNNKPVIAVLFE